MKKGLKQSKNTLVYGFISEKLIRLVKEGKIKGLSDIVSLKTFCFAVTFWPLSFFQFLGYLDTVFGPETNTTVKSIKF